MNPRDRFWQVVEYIVRFGLFMEYFLTAGIRSALFIACYTLALWLFLSEYYMAQRFPWWTGPWEFFFLVPAVGLLVALSIYGVLRLETKRPVAAPLAFPAVMKAPLSTWITMIREAGENCHEWLLRSFLRWEARLLTRYGRKQSPVSFAELPQVWRRSLRHVLALLWFPALLIYLTSPLPLPVMETIAPILSDRAADVAHASVLCRQTGDEETLDSNANVLSFRNPAKFQQGLLKIDLPDFPRVYRRVRAICGGGVPRCTVALKGGIYRLKEWQFLRAGRIEFEFIRSSGGALDLGMELKVFQRDGTTEVSAVDTVLVH